MDLSRTQVVNRLAPVDPGLEIELYLSADLGTFAKVWLGDLPYAAAARTGGVKLTGPRDWTRAFPSWLLLSRFAAVPRPATKAPAAR